MARNSVGGDGGFRVAIKFLVSNGLAGSLIGTGGAAIKELMEVSEARVNVSGATEVYPGTSERVVLITGTESQVSFAQSLVWELIAQNSKAIEAGSRSATWSPRAASENSSGESDEIQVTGRVTIPASAGGMILGRGGSTIRSISEQSGARVNMTGKDEAMFTQERVLTVAGSKSSCSKCIALAVAKLAEDLEVSQFVNRGTVYTSHVGNMYGPGGPGGRGSGGGRGMGGGGGGRMGGMSGMGGRGPMPAGGPMVMGPVNGSADAISASTTISLAVPESLIGNILGKQVIKYEIIYTFTNYFQISH
jgi:RNA-binding protein Nova